LLSRCLDDHQSLVKGLHMVVEDVAHEGYKVKRAKFFKDSPQAAAEWVAHQADVTREYAKTKSQDIHGRFHVPGTEMEPIKKSKAVLARKGAREFLCQVEGCGEDFISNRGLWQHVQVEHQGRRWYCKSTECERPYRASGAVWKHVQRAHNGQKEPPFESQQSEVMADEEEEPEPLV
jgi:hypothetical protein